MIRDQETGMEEASVTINGTPLSFAEAITLRVAVCSFNLQLADEAHRRALGQIGDHYAAHLRRIFRLMVGVEQ